MRRPAFSVIVPLFNKARWVRASLQSALAQTFADFELIVIDDGSTDGSETEVASVAGPRLRIIRQANAGVSVARNAGIAAARAEWLAFLDADDLWDPRHLESFREATALEPVVAVFGNHRLQSQQGGAKIDPSVPPQTVFDFFDFALRNGGYPIGASSVAVRRCEAVVCGGFAPGKPMGEDTDLWRRLALRGPMVYTGQLTSTYNDAPAIGSVARNLSIAAHFPPFAERYPSLLANGQIPAALLGTARAYVNFLLLEFVRQLIDRGDHVAAREVLYRRCSARLDPARFARRLARTFAVGRAVYNLVRSPAM